MFGFDFYWLSLNKNMPIGLIVFISIGKLDLKAALEYEPLFLPVWN